MVSHPLEISVIRNIKYNKDSYAKRFHFNSIEKLLPFSLSLRRKTSEVFHSRRKHFGPPVELVDEIQTELYIHVCARVCVNGSGRVSFFFLCSYSRGGAGSVGPRSFGRGSRHRVHQVDFISEQLPRALLSTSPLLPPALPLSVPCCSHTGPHLARPQLRSPWSILLSMNKANGPNVL